MGNGGQKIIIRIPVEWALCIQLNAAKRKYSSHERDLEIRRVVVRKRTV